MTRETADRSDSRTRPGILKVFWPAILGWGMAVLVFNPWFWAILPTSPDARRGGARVMTDNSALVLLALWGAMVLSPLGAGIVTIAVSSARRRRAVIANFSTLIPSLLGILLALAILHAIVAAVVRGFMGPVEWLTEVLENLTNAIR